MPQRVNTEYKLKAECRFVLVFVGLDFWFKSIVLQLWIQPH